MISERLKAVAGMVTKGKKIADIGTDHGYVPIYLVENSICSKVYAMDINEGPLKIADKNIAIHGLIDKIETIQSNGMEKLKDNMVDGAIISGMGGDLIVDILSRGKNIKGINELVLSPHRRVDLVRKYLLENNWEIIDEKMLILLYSPGTRMGLYGALQQMKEQLEEDETELLDLTNSVLQKLSDMDDEVFEKLSLSLDL